LPPPFSSRLSRDRFAAGGAICSQHIPATAPNLEILTRAGITKVIVHVRDPRQCITSLVKSAQYSWIAEDSSPA